MFPNNTGKKVAVIGSSLFNNEKLFNDFFTPRASKIKLIIIGASKNVDRYSTSFCKKTGIPCLSFSPQCDENGLLGKGAVWKNLWNIIDEADCIMAFDCGSKGTAHAIDIAKQLDKPVQIISFIPRDTL